jgi:uroporphyrinogen-III synthase
MSAPTKTELWELAARIAQADSEDHEDDVVIQPMFDLLEKLSKRQQEILVDLLTPNGKKAFKKALKRVCVGSLSYEQLEELGIEDVTLDKTDPAGIVYHIIVSSWEGEDGL